MNPKIHLVTRVGFASVAHGVLIPLSQGEFAPTHEEDRRIIGYLLKSFDSPILPAKSHYRIAIRSSLIVLQTISTSSGYRFSKIFRFSLKSVVSCHFASIMYRSPSTSTRKSEIYSIARILRPSFV